MMGVITYRYITISKLYTFVVTRELKYMNESKKRSIVKTISYRAILIVVLAVITYIFTGNLVQTSGITIIFSVIATIAYYAHERLWTKIAWS
jgi:uncharacterized membrane protein